MEELGLAQWLAGEHGHDLEAGRTRTYTGVALSDSEGGRVTVDLGGDSVTADGEQGVELPCSPNVKEGDRVTVTVVNGSPTVTGVVGGGDRTAVVIDELSGDVGEVKTIIRQYEDGVLVCKTNEKFGALVNADGSFDVVVVTWSNGVPSVQDTMTRLSAQGASFYVGGGFQTTWIDPYKMSLNGMDLETNQHYSLVWNPETGEYEVSDEAGSALGDPTELPRTGTFGKVQADGGSSDPGGIWLVSTGGSQYLNDLVFKLNSTEGLSLEYYYGNNMPHYLIKLENNGTVSTDYPSEWRTALDITPANIGAAAASHTHVPSEVGVATSSTQTNNVVTSADDTKFTVSSSRIRVLNGVAELVVNLVTVNALTAFTRYSAVATIADGYRPVDEHLIGGILPGGAVLGNVSATGAISFYPLRAISAGASINLRSTFLVA